MYVERVLCGSWHGSRNCFVTRHIRVLRFLDGRVKKSLITV